MKFLLFAVLSFLSLFLITPKNIYAQENFSTEYDVIYSVREDSTTEATVAVTLTNKTSQYFASSYTLQVGFDDIKNVKASDPDGEITPKVTKNEAGHAISLTFNRKSVGLNSKIPFTVTFDTTNVAKKQGKVWEINVPGIANPSDFTNFNVTVNPPSGLTNPIYTKPKNDTGSLTFNKEQLGKSGISIAFGTDQIYSFTVTYHLKNSNVFPIHAEIALPPNTNYQEVTIDSIDPAPTDVTIDRDGNWLAQYSLSPTEKQDIVVRGKSRISLTPRKVSLSSDQRSEYTKPEKYWEVNDPKIQELAKKLKSPENIYKYVVETLKYDFARVTDRQERLGAVKALADPDSAVCLEFTDLFIALSRAAGIPARELNGYAHTENAKQRPLSLVSDILHAWPEYYDEEQQTWIMVDPTWGNTTGGIDYFTVFDFDHFVFVRKGENSNYPIPAGGYKLEEDREKKDVHVGFSFDFKKEDRSVVLTPEIDSVYASGFPIGGNLLVTNTGNTLSQSEEIFFASNSLIPDVLSVKTEQIPPFGKRNIPFGFQSTPLLTNSAYDFTIARNGESTYHTIQVSPFVLTKFRLLGGVTLGLSGLIILIIAYSAGRLFISRRRK